MKIAFVGKGGSGKTTTSSLFVRHLGGLGLPTVAIDADINQHLGVALGLSEDEAAATLPLGLNMLELKDFLRGDNPRITSAESMLKSTPAGRGSRLLQVNGDDPFHQKFGRPVAGATLMVTGPFAEDDLGLSCYHSKIGAAELYLNHVVDGPNEYVVMDMTAGADAFASGLFTRFDVTFLVAEPTRKGVSVYRQYKEYARDHDVKICVVGNKVEDEEDVAFLREHVGDDLLTWLVPSRFVRDCEKGRTPDFAELEAQNADALKAMFAEVNATSQNWARFTRQGHEFHKLYADRWGSRSGGEDLAQQIDPGFVMGLQR
jgi:CO dehydrogenase maturation factor